jgi:glycosyltransferase involved in cell wall biosynthesis
MNNLWVVMPVYNEEECIESVTYEWLEELRKYDFDFTFCILNDGSKDNTLQILKKIADIEKEIKVVDKPNSGHGQTCVYGYNLAIENNAEWVFQIDSDGQCDPTYFKKVLDETDKNPVIYGYRKSRDDGFQRFIVSRIVTYFVFAATGEWVRDANVPYRMMRADYLKNIIDRIPLDFNLANILVSVLLRKMTKIKWVNIHFRDRMGGSPSVKTSLFAKHGLVLFNQLRKAGKGKS